jgi:hypothetical protein
MPIRWTPLFPRPKMLLMFTLVNATDRICGFRTTPPEQSERPLSNTSKPASYWVAPVAPSPAMAREGEGVWNFGKRIRLLESSR